MDLGSIIGLIGGSGLLLSAVMMGGPLGLFINIPSFLIVVGGSLAAAFITYEMKDVITAIKAGVFVFKNTQDDPNNLIKDIISIANVCRKQGMMKASSIKTESKFIKQATEMIADQVDEEIVRMTMSTEQDAMKKRHKLCQDVWDKLALYAPAFGMIGTLIGLVQMLANLADPSTIGPAMSVALITTLYGALAANLFYTPIAGKLKRRTMVEMINLEIIFEGAISIMDSCNPRLVHKKLSAFLPESDRKSYDDISGK